MLTFYLGYKKIFFFLLSLRYAKWERFIEFIEISPYHNLRVDIFTDSQLYHNFRVAIFSFDTYSYISTWQWNVLVCNLA